MAISEKLLVVREVLEHPRLIRCCIDESGIGMQLARRRVVTATLIRCGSLPVKDQLATSLRRRKRDRSIKIPDDDAILRDFHQVKKVVSGAGGVRYDAERTKDRHADRFWAAALCCLAAFRPAPRVGVYFPNDDLLPVSAEDLQERWLHPDNEALWTEIA